MNKLTTLAIFVALLLTSALGVFALRGEVRSLRREVTGQRTDLNALWLNQIELHAKQEQSVVEPTPVQPHIEPVVEQHESAGPGDCPHAWMCGTPELEVSKVDRN